MEQVKNEPTIYSATVYCRLSKDDEQAGESVSIETQKMMLTDFCHERGYSCCKLPMNLSCFYQSGFARQMSNLDPFNNSMQKFRCQLLNIHILANRRIHFPPLHAPRQSPNLIQNIRIQHLMVDDVCLWAFIRAAVVVSTEVDVNLPILELLPRQGKRMTAAVAKQQPPK